jgi:hypothetical protein
VARAPLARRLHASARAVLAIGAAAIALGCAPGCSSTSPEEDPTCTGGESNVYVLTSLQFTRETPKGVAPGFDLDKHVSASPEQQSCGKVDLLGPDGTPGIDNQLALLIPDIEKAVGNAIDGIIQGAINDGRLLIAFDLKGVNSTATDRCVDLEVKLGEGKPTLGTDGVVEAYQTFDLRKQGQLLSPATGGRIENGVFSIGPFPLRIPIAIFDVSFTIYVRDALVRFKIDEDGNVEGLLGGGISIDEVADGVKDGAGVARLIPQIKLVGSVSADLGRDPATEKCTLVSAALAFKARPAFFRP